MAPKHVRGTSRKLRALSTVTKPPVYAEHLVQTNVAGIEMNSPMLCNQSPLKYR